MKDPQVKAAYAWEGDWMYSRYRALSGVGVRRWVQWACKQYGVKPPVVRIHRLAKGGTSFYDPSTHSIEFRKRHLNMWTALHEAAHAIETQLLDAKQPHGPEWLGIFLALLLKAGVAPREALYGSARAAGLSYSPPGKIGPRAIRKHYKKARRKKRHY